MIVFCAGLRSSASTLQYQIAKHLIESNGLGYGFIRSNNRTLNLQDLDTNKYIVVKTHKLNEKTHDIIASYDTKILMTVRDLRDELCSLMQRKSYNFDGAFKRMLVYKNEQFEWLEFENKMLTFRYCDFVNDIENHVYKIASFFDIPTTQFDARFIATQYSLEHNKKRLGRNHITDAKVGKYKDMLTSDQIAKIESECSEWLKKYNYL